MDMNYGGGECGREEGGQDGVESGGKWDNCNSIINKYIKKKKKSKICENKLIHTHKKKKKRIQAFEACFVLYGSGDRNQMFKFKA